MSETKDVIQKTLTAGTETEFEKAEDERRNYEQYYRMQIRIDSQRNIHRSLAA